MTCSVRDAFQIQTTDDPQEAERQALEALQAETAAAQKAVTRHEEEALEIERRVRMLIPSMLCACTRREHAASFMKSSGSETNGSGVFISALDFRIPSDGFRLRAPCWRYATW